MIKNKKRNNSVNLNSTITRAAPHSKSFFVDSAGNTNSNKMKETSTKQRQNSNYHYQPSAQIQQQRPILTGNISKIYQNTRKCTKINSELQTSIIEKTLKINKLLQQLHHFSICVQDLRWLLTEGDKKIKEHLKKTQLISPDSPYTEDIGELAKEFRSLVLRFGTLDKVNIRGIEEWLQGQRIDREKKEGGTPSMFDETKANYQLRRSLESSRVFGKESSPLQKTNLQHFSHPLKQNTNNSNFSTHFQNIKIIPSKQIKEIPSEPSQTFEFGTQIPQHNYNLSQQLQKQKDSLYSRLKQEYHNNQDITGRNQSLKDEISSRDCKISKYRVLAQKSLQLLGDVLRNLVNSCNKSDKEFQLLRMAQCLSNWEKMMDQEQDQMHYQTLYGDPQVLNLEKTQKMQQIIGLQYQINNLLGQKNSLSKQNADISASPEKGSPLMEDYYQMLTVQAISLEQLCSY